MWRPRGLSPNGGNATLPRQPAKMLSRIKAMRTSCRTGIGQLGEIIRWHGRAVIEPQRPASHEVSSKVPAFTLRTDESFGPEETRKLSLSFGMTCS
jgi:hypothetical protein